MYIYASPCVGIAGYGDVCTGCLCLWIAGAHDVCASYALFVEIAGYKYVCTNDAFWIAGVQSVLLY